LSILNSENIIKNESIESDMRIIGDSGDFNPRKIREYIPRATRNIDTKKT